MRLYGSRGVAAKIVYLLTITRIQHFDTNKVEAINSVLMGIRSLSIIDRLMGIERYMQVK